MVTPLLLALALATAADQPPPTFGFSRFLRTTVALGSVPRVGGRFLADTLEWGLRPFEGAFATGLSLTGGGDALNRWFTFTGGVFLELDLTYLFLTGFWAVKPPKWFPFRLHLGTRIGIDFSASWQPRDEEPSPRPYQLLRPALHTFVDLELPLGPRTDLSLFLRGSMDTPMNVSSVYRWSLGVGFCWGYGPT